MPRVDVGVQRHAGAVVDLVVERNGTEDVAERSYSKVGEDLPALRRQVDRPDPIVQAHHLVAAREGPERAEVGTAAVALVEEEAMVAREGDDLVPQARALQRSLRTRGPRPQTECRSR